MPNQPRAGAHVRGRVRFIVGSGPQKRANAQKHAETMSRTLLGWAQLPFPLDGDKDEGGRGAGGGVSEGALAKT